MYDEQNDEFEIDLKDLFLYVMRHCWIVVLAVLIGALGFGIYSNMQDKPMYSSTASMYILSQSEGKKTLSDIQLGTQLINDYIVLVKSKNVVNEVISNLNLDMSNGELASNITVDNPTDTRILDITVTNEDPKLAKDIVNELAKVTGRQVSEIMEMEQPNIVDAGSVSTTPVGSGMKKNILIGGILGLLLSGGIIVFLYFMNDKISTEEQVERYLGLKTLGMLPMEKKKRNKKELVNDTAVTTQAVKKTNMSQV